MGSRRITVRLAWLGACVAAVTMACTSSSESTSAGTASRGAAIDGGMATGTSGGEGVTPPPVVACTERSDTADPSDAGDGDDAGDGADAGEAGAPRPVDAGADPCASPPPPACESERSLAVYGAGACGAGRCVFPVTARTPCAGGCFRQSDGGPRCNE